MIDLGLVSAAKKAIAAKPRHRVTPAILLAFVMQESSGVPYFDDHKPGSLYLLNVYDAIRPELRHKDGTLINRYPTGLTEPEIRQAITMPATINGWTVPKNMVGQKAKFRFELSAWSHAIGADDKIKRFRLACSWGLVQFMAFNIVGELKGDAADLAIQRFAADTDMQLLYAAGMIDELLEKTCGDVDFAYRGYNSGDVNTKDIAVMCRARSVEQSAIQIATQIGEK